MWRISLRFVLMVWFLVAGTLFAEEKEKIEQKKVLLVFEEANSYINKWRVIFKDEFMKQGFIFEEIPVAEAGKKDFSKYDFIEIYGAVMAFTYRQPIREWLKTETNISGKKVGLFVTANRWFLEKYYKQLEEILKGKKAIVVDSVSSATLKLSEEEKRKLISNHIEKIKKEDR